MRGETIGGGRSVSELYTEKEEKEGVGVVGLSIHLVNYRRKKCFRVIHLQGGKEKEEKEGVGVVGLSIHLANYRRKKCFRVIK